MKCCAEKMDCDGSGACDCSAAPAQDARRSKAIRFRRRERLRAGRSPARREPLRPRIFGSTLTGTQSNTFQAGVVSTSTSDYKYQGQLEAVVDVYTMGDSTGAQDHSGDRQSRMRRAFNWAMRALHYAQSVNFRKGPYLVRIVAYESTPDARRRR